MEHKCYKTVTPITVTGHATILAGAQIYVSTEDARALFALTEENRFARNIVAQSLHLKEEDPAPYEEIEICRQYLRKLAESVLFTAGPSSAFGVLVNNLSKEFIHSSDGYKKID